MPIRLIVPQGAIFGRWTVVKEIEPRSHPRCFECLCKCGQIRILRLADMRRRKTSSCGCLNRDLLVARSTIHGAARQDQRMPEYSVWSSIIVRCENAKRLSWKNYGGRGIQVCERWRNSFPAFLEDMGPKPTSQHSIDRIDNNGNYEPTNCRWATQTEQSRNTRRNVWVTYKGRMMILADAIAASGMKVRTIYSRHQHGYPDPELFLPIVKVS